MIELISHDLFTSKLLRDFQRKGYQTFILQEKHRRHTQRALNSDIQKESLWYLLWCLKGKVSNLKWHGPVHLSSQSCSSSRDGFSPSLLLLYQAVSHEVCSPAGRQGDPVVRGQPITERPSVPVCQSRLQSDIEVLLPPAAWHPADRALCFNLCPVLIFITGFRGRTRFM